MFKTVNEAVGYVEGLKRTFKKTSLERMNTILAHFGNPHKKLKAIHIAGTNGKGSTAIFITNILMELGYDVCTYVSPYVTTYSERIEYNLNYIDDSSLLDLINYVDSNKPFSLSFFEFTTLLSFLYFAKVNPDYCVIECGMGGLLDDTNVIDSILSIITNVTLDHQAQLGNTIEEICLNKIGIIKEKQIVLFKDNESINYMAIDRCDKLNSKLYLINNNGVSNLKLDETKTSYDYSIDGALIEGITLRMLGFHQVDNSVMAINAIYRLFGLNDKVIEAIKKGLFKSFWPARLELVKESPITYLDGCHNIDGVKRICEYLDTFDKTKVTIICAISSDKLVSEMVNMLAKRCNKIYFTKFDYRRSDESSNLFNLCNSNNKGILDNCDEVIKYIEETKDEIIFCLGSLYFTSQIRKMLLG